MSIQQTIESATQQGFKSIYDVTIDSVEFQATRKDFEGDITIVVFPFLRIIKGNPVEIGTKLGEYLKENVADIIDFNVVKGFLNLVINDTYFTEQFQYIYQIENYGCNGISSQT